MMKRLRPGLLPGLCILVLMVSSCCSQKNNSAQDEKGKGTLSERLARGEDIIIEGREFSSAVDFLTASEGVAETPGLARVWVNSALVFKNCVFKEEVSAFAVANDRMTAASFMKSILFEGCTFEKDLNLRAATVGGGCTFLRCTFKAPVNIQELRCEGPFSIQSSTFAGDLRAQGAVFRDKFFGMDASFTGQAAFQEATFWLDAQFAKARFKGYADFSLCDFRGQALYDYAEFSQRSIFSRIRVQDRASFVKSSFGDDSSFKEATFFGKAVFNQAIVKKKLDLGTAKDRSGELTFDQVLVEDAGELLKPGG